VVAAGLLQGQTSVAQLGRGDDSAAASATTATPAQAARPADPADAQLSRGGDSSARSGSSGTAVSATTATPARAARPADPADWSVSAPATLVAPVGSRVEFTVAVHNPGRAARGTIVFALNGLVPELPSGGTLERRSHGRWVALPEEGAAGTRYLDTETLTFRHGRNVFRFRIGHPADASPNRLRMRTFAQVAGTNTPSAHTTVEVPARTP
jgi:hypothetical protein